MNQENWYNFSNISSIRVKHGGTLWEPMTPFFPCYFSSKIPSSIRTLAALVNQSWLILPLVETWWFGRHSSRLRRYNLNGFSVATVGIDWNGSRSGAVIFSDRWTNAELAPRWIRGNDFSVASIASFSAVRWLIRVTNLHGIGWRIGLSIYDSF